MLSDLYGVDSWERRQYTSQRRKQLREQVVAYKGGSCRICGYDSCTAALELHHPDPREKEFNISSRLTSFKAIQQELDKCVLLCCRCHREVHDGLHPGYLVDEDWYDDVLEGEGHEGHNGFTPIIGDHLV